jgi:hypothetical protein
MLSRMLVSSTLLKVIILDVSVPFHFYVME